MRRKSVIEAELKAFDDIASLIEDAEVLLDMATEASDAETAKESDEKIKEAFAAIKTEEVKRVLSGEHDHRNAIVELHPGAGGTEAQDWGEMLLRMYTRWCEERGFTPSIIDYQPGEEAGIKSVTFMVEGEYAFGYMKAESGVHRLVRISPYDAAKRRHTSFVAVFVYPEIEDIEDVEINETELRIDTYRAGGAGGQHVNKTDSAVRITHIPTGIVVQCQNERSQHKNKAVAMKVLASRLYELRVEEEEAKLAGLHKDKRKIEWGSQIRSYVLQPYRLVKDHRTGEETGDVDSVLDGHIDPFIEAFLTQRAKGG